MHFPYVPLLRVAFFCWLEHVHQDLGTSSDRSARLGEGGFVEAKFWSMNRFGMHAIGGFWKNHLWTCYLLKIDGGIFSTKTRGQKSEIKIEIARYWWWRFTLCLGSWAAWVKNQEKVGFPIESKHPFSWAFTAKLKGGVTPCESKRLVVI